MATLLVPLLVLTGGQAAQAAGLDHDVDWVRTGGSAAFDIGRGVGTDAAGNTYVAAQMSGPASFATGGAPSSAGDTSGTDGRASLALVKYDATGGLAWARVITGTGDVTYGGFRVTPAGDLAVTAGFTGTVTFGDNPGDPALTATPGTARAFVARYGPDGLAQWVAPLTATAAGSSAPALAAGGVAISAAGVVVTGSYGGSVTAGSPTSGGAPGPTATAAGPSDLFVAAFDPGGAATWITSASAAAGSTLPRSIAMTDAGASYTTGTVTGSVTWGTGPGAPTTVASDADPFVLALDPTGARRWVETPASADTDQGWAVAVDPAGTTLVVTGSIGGVAQFGNATGGPAASGGAPGTTTTVAAPAPPTAYVAGLDPTSGAAIWATAQFGPGRSIATAVHLAPDGSVAVGGIFVGVAAFAGPPPVVATATHLNGFALVLDPAGRATSLLAPSGPGDSGSLVLGVAIDASDTITETGAVRGATTFSGAAGSTLANDDAGNADAFVARLPLHQNHAPEVSPATAATVAAHPVAITLAATDADGDPISFTLDTDGPGAAAHGSLAGTPPNLTYTPEPDFVGVDTFVFHASDTNGATSDGTATITVLSDITPPNAGGRGVVTIRDRVTPITLQGTDVGGGALAYAVSTPPIHGTLTGTAPALVYTPGPGYLGADAFDYTVTDDRGQTAIGSITIAVKQPNVVMIMTDDETLEQQRFLPRTNALLGAEGTTFTNAVVSYSECCPARATFLSGQYAHNHGVLSSALPTGGVSKFDHSNSLVTWLQANGYYTSLTGKFMNGYGTDMPATTVPPGWSDWYALYEPSTYEYFNYDVSVNGVPEHHGHRIRDYSTDVLAAHAEAQIRTHGGSAQPFFVDFTPTAPHVTNQGLVGIPAPRHAGSLIGEQAPRGASFNQADVSTLPPWVQALPRFTDAGIAGVDNIYRIDSETLRAVDDGVERLYNALRDTGELDNTIIMFTSDNGLHYGDRRMLNSKSDPYEETVRVPLLVRGPGFPAGATVTQPVANIDLAPTITALTGTTPGRVADGVPLTNFVGHPTYGQHRTVVLENGPLLGRRLFKGVRDDQWSYIEWNTGARELFNLVADPYETTNLANDTNQRLRVLALSLKLKALKDCVGPACRSGIS